MNHEGQAEAIGVLVGFVVRIDDADGEGEWDFSVSGKAAARAALSVPQHRRPCDQILDLPKWHPGQDHQSLHIAIGNRGAGKTHISLGLGLAACQRGMSVGFTPGDRQPALR